MNQSGISSNMLDEAINDVVNVSLDENYTNSSLDDGFVPYRVPIAVEVRRLFIRHIFAIFV